MFVSEVKIKNNGNNNRSDEATACKGRVHSLTFAHL
jgi:hypothetical protein